MLTVTVLFFASYREQAKTNTSVIYVPKGSDLSRVITVVCESYPDIKCPPKNIVAAINEEYRDHSTIINQGDTIALIPPVSGG